MVNIIHLIALSKGLEVGLYVQLYVVAKSHETPSGFSPPGSHSA